MISSPFNELRKTTNDAVIFPARSPWVLPSLVSRSAHRHIDNLFEIEIVVDCRFHHLSFDLHKERLLRAVEIAASLPTFNGGSIIGWTEQLQGS